MLNALEGDRTGSELEELWPEEVTAVIPADRLALLRDEMDTDDRPTARFAPVTEQLLAVGTMTGLRQADVCEEVSVSPRAIERSVTAAPAAHLHRAWLIAVALVLLAIEVLALAW